jgi:hypothetical protein
VNEVGEAELQGTSAEILAPCEHGAAALRSQLWLPTVQRLLQPVGVVVDTGPCRRHGDAASTHAAAAFLAAIATRRPATSHAIMGHGLDWGMGLWFQDYCVISSRGFSIKKHLTCCERDGFNQNPPVCDLWCT